MLERIMTTMNDQLEHLEDRSLLEAAMRLAGEERRATTALLRALMEIDARRLYLGEGYASMFSYCTRVLHLAEGAAYNRIEATRAARRYPVVLDLLEQSAITLTTVRLLAPLLTPENHVTVLASARHRSKREVEELAASLKPKPDAPAVVRKLPRRESVSMVPQLLAERTTDEAPAGPTPSVAEPQSDVPSLPAAPLRVIPFAPERYRIQLTVSRDTHDKFRRVQALLRHAVPSGDAAEIFDRAISLLVERLEHQRFAQAAQPRASKTGSEHSRYIPAGVRREVWRRDGGRCAFVGGEARCGETAFLEFHHVEPYAAGGRGTVENIELRCRAHNAYEAQQFFGHGLVREHRACWGRLVPERVRTGETVAHAILHDVWHRLRGRAADGA
jgi:hypothetical protein